MWNGTFYEKRGSAICQINGSEYGIFGEVRVFAGDVWHVEASTQNDAEVVHGQFPERDLILEWNSEGICKLWLAAILGDCMICWKAGLGIGKDFKIL